MCNLVSSIESLIPGRVSGFSEVRLKDAGTTAKNSTSMRRKPGPPTESTRGSSINFPFWPGGFDPDDIALNAEVSLEEDDSGYLTCPPGLIFCHFFVPRNVSF